MAGIKRLTTKSLKYTHKIIPYWQIGILFPNGKKLSKPQCSLEEVFNTYFIKLENYLNSGLTAEELLDKYVNTFKSKGIMTKTNRVGKFKTVILFPTIIFGLAMTKLYSLINVFVPLLILSTRLQLQTSASYINEYKCEYEKKHHNSYQEEKHIDSVRSESYDREITKEKLINLKNELLFYTCNDIDIKLPKRKIKSL